MTFAVSHGQHRARAGLIPCCALLAAALAAASTAVAQQGDASFERGLQAAQRGDTAAAERELREAVRLEPRRADALAALGAVLGMQGKLQESSGYLEKAVEVNPSDSGSRRNLASNQFQLGQLEKARTNLQQLLRQQPGDAQATLLLGMVSEELRDDATALRLLDAVPQLVGQRPQSVIALARVLYRSGKTSTAQATLRKLSSFRDQPDAVLLGAQAAMNARDWSQAESMFAAVAESHPDQPKVALQLAEAQYRNGHPTQARKTLTSLLAEGHQSADAFNLLGWCFFREGNLKDAIASLDLAIDREPGKAAHYIDVGLMLFSDKRYSAALEAAHRAVKAEPDSYRARMLAGLAQTRLNRLDEALASYHKAKELQPSAAEPWLATGIVLSAGNREQEAEQVFQSALDRFPKNALIEQEYAKFLLRISAGQAGPRQTKAKQLLEAALTRNDGLADAHYELGKLELEADHAAQAMQHLERAASLAPDAARNHFLLARAYRAAGRDDDAGRELSRFRELQQQKKPTADSSKPEGSGDAERNFVLMLEP